MTKWIREELAPIVAGIVVPLITAVTGYLVWDANQRISTVETNLKSREQVRVETAGERDFHFRVYEAVTGSLESSDVRRQRVAKALVVAMLDPDDKLRSGLLEILSAEGEGDVRVEAAKALSEQTSFATQQSDISSGPASPPGDYRSYNVDVFWCSGNGDSARTLAAKVIEALKTGGVEGRLRLRELPKSINAAPGYRIEGLVVRREIGEESAAAQIKKIADTAAGPNEGKFVDGLSRQGTPNYLSLFVCR